MDIINIYTDGACSKNPGPGAYAAVLLYKDNEKIISGYKEWTTNQEMEISAVLNALKSVKNKDIAINLYSDSKYVLDGMMFWMHDWAKKQWKKDIKHKQIWQEIYILYNTLKINCIWVKGHSNNLYNEQCDKIAKNLIKDNKRSITTS
jgi:ribonuclease HI